MLFSFGLVCKRPAVTAVPRSDGGDGDDDDDDAAVDFLVAERPVPRAIF